MNLCFAPTADLTVPQLVAKIEATHHTYLRLTLPNLALLSRQIARQHTVEPRSMDRLQREFAVLVDLLEMHLQQQEEMLFPDIVHRRPGSQCDTIVREVVQQREENQEILGRMQRVVSCFEDPAWCGKGALVDELRTDLSGLQRDLTEHFELEETLLARLQSNPQEE